MQTYNIVITNVSKVNLHRETHTLMESEYVDVDGNHYIGVMTNEAPIKSIMKRLENQNQKIDKILYIESDTVRNEIRVDGKYVTHGNLLRERVNSYAGESGFYIPEYEPGDSIPIADEPDEAGVSDAIFKVYNELLKAINQNDAEIRLFVEANGGVRYVLTMLLSIINSLEASYDNVHVEEITSMVYNNTPSPVRFPITIRNTKTIFDTAQITGIVDEFLNYGRINSLKNYLDSRISPEYRLQQEETCRAIEQIQGLLEILANDIQLCRTAMLMDDFYKDGGLLSELNRFLEKYKEASDPTVSIVRYVCEIIKKELEATIYHGIDLNSLTGAVNKAYLPIVINWCLSKGFVQQALTLCAERLPEYLFDTGRISLHKGMERQLQETDTKEYEETYYFVAHMPEFTNLYKDAKVNAVLEELKIMNYAAFSEEQWNEMHQHTKLKQFEKNDEIMRCAKVANEFITAFMKLSDRNRTKERLNQVLNQNHIHQSFWDRKITYSKNITGVPITLALQGKYIRNGAVVSHIEFADARKRLTRIVPAFISFMLYKRPATEVYDHMLDSLFADHLQLADSLKQKYSYRQSGKYDICEVMNGGYIQSTMPKDDLQLLLYLYSICKEQRNLSNHAHVSTENKSIAMHTSQLQRVIEELLKYCN